MRLRVRGEYHAIMVEDQGYVPIWCSIVVEGVAARDEATEVAGRRGIRPGPLEAQIRTGFDGCLQYVEVMAGGAANDRIALWRFERRQPHLPVTLIPYYLHTGIGAASCGARTRRPVVQHQATRGSRVAPGQIDRRGQDPGVWTGDTEQV